MFLENYLAIIFCQNARWVRWQLLHPKNSSTLLFNSNTITINHQKITCVYSKKKKFFKWDTCLHPLMQNCSCIELSRRYYRCGILTEFWSSVKIYAVWKLNYAEVFKQMPNLFYLVAFVRSPKLQYCLGTCSISVPLSKKPLLCYIIIMWNIF